MEGATRTVELWELNVGNDICFFRDLDYEKFLSIIGYLATWAPHDKRIARVTIGFTPNLGSGQPPEMVAQYWERDGKLTFTIGAVWRADEKRFTTHS